MIGRSHGKGFFSLVRYFHKCSRVVNCLLCWLNDVRRKSANSDCQYSSLTVSVRTTGELQLHDTAARFVVMLVRSKALALKATARSVGHSSAATQHLHTCLR